MKQFLAVLAVVAFFAGSIANAQDQEGKKDEPVAPAPAPAMTEAEAEVLYYGFGEKLNTAIQNVPQGAPMFLAQMSILADHSTVFSDEDKKLLDEAGVALFGYQLYYDEIVELLPVNFESPKELIPIFSDEKRLARIKTIVEAMTVLSAAIVSKINALVDKIPASDRMADWMTKARDSYETAKNPPAPPAENPEKKD